MSMHPLSSASPLTRLSALAAGPACNAPDSGAHTACLVRCGRSVAWVATLAASALFTTGCESMGPQTQGTAAGAGIGAVAGALIGSATGGRAGSSALIGASVGAVAGNLWSRQMEQKRAALAQASAGTGIQVARTPDNRLKLNVPSDFSFDVGRADIKPEMRPVLDEMARNLDPHVKVTVVGHTDSSGSDTINDPLSMQRADAVRQYLALRGVGATRVDVLGRGSREPLASNATPAGRAQNRRVEIFLAEPQA